MVRDSRGDSTYTTSSYPSFRRTLLFYSMSLSLSTMMQSCSAHIGPRGITGQWGHFWNQYLQAIGYISSMLNHQINTNHPNKGVWQLSGKYESGHNSPATRLLTDQIHNKMRPVWRGKKRIRKQSNDKLCKKAGVRLLNRDGQSKPLWVSKCASKQARQKWEIPQIYHRSTHLKNCWAHVLEALQRTEVAWAGS